MWKTSGALLVSGFLLSAAAASEELVGHGGAVRSLAASRTGLLLSGSFDTSIMLWRPGERKAPARFTLLEGPVNAVAISTDGRRAAAGGDDGRLVVLDLESGQILWRREFEAKVLTLALSEGAGLIAAGTADGALHVLTLEDGAPRATASLGTARPTALLFDEQKGAIWVATHTGALVHVEPARGAVSERLPASGFAIADMVQLPDGILALGCIDGTVRLRRLPDLEPVGELAGHEAPITALALEPDGRRLASGDIKGRIVLWSLAERRPERVLEPHRGPVWDLVFSGPDSTLWSAGNDAIVRRWREGEPPPRPAAAEEPGASARARDDAATEAPDRGARLFRACVACHTVTADSGNRAGPTLFGIFGRRAGSVPGYPYSEALAKSGIVWTEETIEQLFALGPDVLTPGSKMPLQRMPDAQDRAALIAYLKRVTTPAARSSENGG